MESYRHDCIGNIKKKKNNPKVYVYRSYKIFIANIFVIKS